MKLKKQLQIDQEKKRNVPIQHIAFIMDGNGRWAKKRMLPRHLGHREAFFRLIEIAEACQELGIKYMSIFAFSTENWKRPQDEIDHLFKYLEEFIEKELPKLIKQQCHIVVSGDITRLPDSSQMAIKKALKATEHFDQLTLNVCLNYGGQDDIIRACKSIVKDVEDKKITIDQIDSALFQNHLYTTNMPMVDLLIRTSGEQRISNYMLFQIAYSELIFTKTLWPDFTKEKLYECLDRFMLRSRRYGGL
jgi:undecaprenyl diphosphate synthase